MQLTKGQIELALQGAGQTLPDTLEIVCGSFYGRRSGRLTIIRGETPEEICCAMRFAAGQEARVQ
jgi:hypothetical protein